MSNSVEFKINPVIKNRAILAFAYKLIDHFPNLTLFGSIVREIIAPAFVASKYPFSNAYQCEYDLNDIDIIFTFDKKNENKELRFELKNMRPKIREWDWWIDSEEKLEVYGVKGARYHVTNLILDINIHIDFVVEDSQYSTDFDVNNLRFNKKKGLFCKSDINISIDILRKYEENLYFQNLLKLVEKKECNSVYGLHKTDGHDEKSKEYIGRNILSIKRYIKMIKNSWKVNNQNDIIKIHQKTNNDHLCSICLETPIDIHCELTCSKCILCLECFENLMKNMSFSSCTFKCPTCKKDICPF